jgi:UDP:flavonoid glycosyltransferase YjiC (YdhE family)
MSPKRRILLISIGSYGDFVPFLQIGRELVRRGYEVSFATSGYFTQFVEAAGMKIIPIGTADDYRNHVNNKAWSHPVRGILFARTLIGMYLGPLHQHIREEWPAEKSLIVSSVFNFLGKLVNESMGYSTVTINLAPISLGSLDSPPTVSHFLSPARLPSFLHRSFGRIVHRVTDGILGKPIHDFRRSLGLSPIRDVMKWWHSPQCSVSLFPEWFFPEVGDLPSNHIFAGFPCGTPAMQSVSIDEATRRFIERADQALLFCPGSNVSSLRQYSSVCSEVCRSLDCEGIIAGPAGNIDEMGTLDRITISRFVPLQEVLPKVRAVVHHGGIGTIAASLESGVPQLMRPVMVDQPENAARCANLGVGRSIAMSNFQSRKVAQWLTELTTSPDVGKKCRHYRSLIEEDRGLTKAVDILESQAI